MRRLIMMLAVFSSIALTAQTKKGTVKGVITDSNSADPIPFANITLFQNQVQITGTTTDFDGKYTFSGLDTGLYDMKVFYVGFQTKEIKEIAIKESKITEANVKLEQGVALQEVLIVEYSRPLIKADKTTVSQYRTRKNIQRMAVRSANDIAKSAGKGSYSKKRKGLKVRGSRSSSNVTFVDGIKVIGSTAAVSANYENEKYQDIKDNEFQSTSSSPLSTISIDVDRAAYANARRYINDGSLPPASAVRIEEMINYFEYDYPQPEGEHPFTVTTEYSVCPWNKQRRIALIGIQGEDIDMSSAPMNNLVFLIDVSGSMGSPDKLELLVNGLELLVDQLRDQDKISIVVYAGAAGVVLNPTSGSKKEKIKGVLNKLSAGGSTAGGEGIRLAYQLAEKNFKERGNNRVILATDGDFNVGVSSHQGLVKLIEKEREKGIFLSVLGFGTGNLNDYSMEQLADKGNGNYNYIDNLLEAKKVLVNEIGGTLLTIAKDVKVQAEFNPRKVKSYRLIGYVNRTLEDEDFNNDKKDAGELGSNHTVTVLYEIIPKESEEVLVDIDELKYQDTDYESASDYSEEVLTVKFRYKKPDEKKSILCSTVLIDNKMPFVAASENIKFSLAVASFVMLLRGSESVQDYSYKDVISLAKESRGEDRNGYRSEFIRLVETAELIK